MMKKRLLSLALCAALLSAGAVVSAESKNDISVEVDKRIVFFDDQKPVIEDSRTLVPLRGVLEAMGASVEWDGETRRVTVNAYDNRTRLILYIDDTNIRKLTFPSVTEVESEDVTSDVAPKILNDRTMIPLRVISENLEAEVDWNADAQKVTIKSKQYKRAVAGLAEEGKTEDEVIAAKTVKMGIDADKLVVNEGDSVTVKLNIENTGLYENAGLAGVTATLIYDSDMLTYTGHKALSGGEEVATYAGVVNDKFKNNSVKLIYLLDPNLDYALADGTVTEVTFVANKTGKTEISLSNRYTNLGSDTHLMLKVGDKSEIISGADKLNIDTAALELNIDEKSADAKDETQPDESNTDDPNADEGNSEELPPVEDEGTDSNAADGGADDK